MIERDWLRYEVWPPESLCWEQDAVWFRRNPWDRNSWRCDLKSRFGWIFPEDMGGL